VWSHSTSSDTQDIKVESRISKYGALHNPVLDTVHTSQRDDVRRRVEELQAAKALEYPRIKGDAKATSCAEFRKSYGSLKPEESKEGEIVTLRGTFLDISQKLVSKGDRKVVLFANSGIKARVHGCCTGWLQSTGNMQSWET
jgi:hypothetical protein